jgi:hypothetical protein
MSYSYPGAEWAGCDVSGDPTDDAISSTRRKTVEKRTAVPPLAPIAQDGGSFKRAFDEDIFEQFFQPLWANGKQLDRRRQQWLDRSNPPMSHV